MFTPVCLKRGWFLVCFRCSIVITQRGGQGLNTYFLTFCKRVSFVYLSWLKFENKYWHKYAHMFKGTIKMGKGSPHHFLQSNEANFFSIVAIRTLNFFLVCHMVWQKLCFMRS